MTDSGVKHNGRVLLIDDNPEIHLDFGKILCPAGGKAGEVARLRMALFGQGDATPLVEEQLTFTLESAHQGEEGLKEVGAAVEEGRPYALAFVDMRMPPGWDGVQTVRELWRADPELQIVVCTAYSDNPWTELEQIARDSDRLLVLKKPFDAIEVKRLAAALTVKWALGRSAALKLIELETLVGQRTAELEQARHQDRLRLDELEAVVQRRTAELRLSATHDDLTGLPNRALLHDRLAQALQVSKRDPSNLIALLFVDFDRFKVVNDSLGHAAGDKLLRLIAERLTSVLRSSDTIAQTGPFGSTAARLGGDEFCVLLTGLSRAEDAARIAERILESMRQPYELNGREMRSTASIGIAVNTLGYDRAEDLVRDADNAMYRAKASGRARYVMFDRAMHAEAMERLLIENDLHRAIDRNQLRTYFQPVVSLVTGELVGTEALVRWERAERGLVPPVDFIKIAEETGFIRQMGLWVLEDACRQLAEWKRQLPRARHMTVSVNVSKRQLDDPLFGDQVDKIVQRTGIEPRSLILEITETVLMDKPEEVGEVLRRFKSMGIRTFLDDFGTGYSSLSVVHTFPIDGLKIDRSFVSGIPGRRRFAAMIHTMMNLVQNLEMEAVAEGVEAIEHVALLQALGCVKAQGYLFSPPVAAEAIATMLQQPMGSWGLSRIGAA